MCNLYGILICEHAFHLDQYLIFGSFCIQACHLAEFFKHFVHAVDAVPLSAIVPVLLYASIEHVPCFFFGGRAGHAPGRDIGKRRAAGESVFPGVGVRQGVVVLIFHARLQERVEQKC